MPVNLRDPNDPLAPFVPQYPQNSYPVAPSTAVPFAPTLLATPNRPFDILPPGYNTPKPSQTPGLQLLYDFRPPRVTPQIPPARIPPSPVAAVTSPALYNNVNYSNLPKLKVAGLTPIVATTIDIYQQLR